MFVISRAARVDQENLGGRSKPAGMKSPPCTPSSAKRDSDILWMEAGAWFDGGALAPMQHAAQALHDACCAAAGSAESPASWVEQCADAARCSGASCCSMSTAETLPHEGDMTSAIP